MALPSTKEKVIDFVAIFQKSFPDSNATTCGEIDRAAILNDPTAIGQQFVDFFASEFFWGRHDDASVLPARQKISIVNRRSEVRQDA